MYTCIRNLVVTIVAFIHDEHEIEVHCAASLQLLYDLIWDIPVQFQLQLAHYQAQEHETIGHVGVDLRAHHKKFRYKANCVVPCRFRCLIVALATHEGKKAIWSSTGGCSTIVE